MEELNVFVAGLKSFLDTVRKVGSSPRSEQWIETCTGNLNVNGIKLDSIYNTLINNVQDKEKENLEKEYILGKSTLEQCRAALDKIKANKEKDTMANQSNFNLSTVSKIIKEYSGGDGIEDYVDAIRFCNRRLNAEGSRELTDYVYCACLKGPAKRAFLEVPASLDKLIEVLLERFTPKETIAELNQKLSQCSQENRTVSKYANDIEDITHRLIALYIAKQGPAARTTAQSIVDDIACSAFKSGLRTDLQSTVIASGVNTFASAVTKALEAEAAQKTVVGQANAYRGKKPYKNGFGYSGNGGYRFQTPRWGSPNYRPTWNNVPHPNFRPYFQQPQYSFGGPPPNLNQRPPMFISGPGPQQPYPQRFNHGGPSSQQSGRNFSSNRGGRGGINNQGQVYSAEMNQGQWIQQSPVPEQYVEQNQQQLVGEQVNVAEEFFRT